jgi:hypothetical protein
MLQGITGIVLYFMKGYPNQFGNIGNLSEMSRFYLLRHSIAILISITLCNIGYVRAMKAKTDITKFKTIAVFYTVALFIILFSIPWKFVYSWAK